MAFISMIFVYFIGFCILLGLGIAPIIAGTILYHKTERKKLGIALRILGYVMLIFGLAVLTAIFWRVS